MVNIHILQRPAATKLQTARARRHGFLNKKNPPNHHGGSARVVVNQGYRHVRHSAILTCIEIASSSRSVSSIFSTPACPPSCEQPSGAGGSALLQHCTLRGAVRGPGPSYCGGRELGTEQAVGGP